MQAGLKNKGAQEFIAIFDRLLGTRGSGPVPNRAATQAFGFVPRAFRPQN
jgi:hypothetical protein